MMKPVRTVLPDKYNEKNFVSTFMGVINEYVPIPCSRNVIEFEEQVFWAKFENFDLVDTTNKCAFPLLLSIGTCKAFYIWGVSFDGKASLLFSEKNSCTIDCKLLPALSSSSGDVFSEMRPIAALCDSFNRSCCQWQVRFLSLMNNKSVLTLYFESRSISVDANSRFVLVARVDCITILSASTLTECFTITCIKPILLSSFSTKNIPFALGLRWIAFADSKPIYHHLSRCGDASPVESQPLTTTVMNMNKRIWNRLSALANTVAPASAQPGSVASPLDSSRQSSHGSEHQSTSSATDSKCTPPTESGDPLAISPGYVTVVDMVTLHQQYEVWKRLEGSTATVCISGASPVESADSYSPQMASGCRFCGTSYVNVHDHPNSGALVAHFMAHRWANVSLLRFDSAGSLLFTACTRGHSFNVFRISSHPCDERQTAVHHLYILERGALPCEVLDATFSNDSRWVAVSTNHGTTHVFPITAYGGLVTVRTHTRPYVVNRTSRYHRSSGLEEHHLTRPQPERGSTDMTAVGSGDHSRVTHVSSNPSHLLPGVMCRGAPMAGLTPQCPHLGFPIGPLDNSASFMRSGSVDVSPPHVRISPKSATSDNSFVPSFVEGACACPLNAVYNAANPRLPPYPEPCVIKPEARLRPHNPGSSTTGAAAAALGGALEAVASGASAVSSGSRTSPASFSFPSAPVPHPGPCVHNPLPEQAPSGPRQPLPIVDPFVDSWVWPPVGPIMVARFAPPICFLPTRPRSTGSLLSQKRDPYGSKSPAVDGLFILATDLHLIEYDLNVLPAESAYCGEKFYQDGSIRLECVPVGEWNLRTSSTYLPPFPKTHPFRLLGTDFQNPRKSCRPLLSSTTSDSSLSQNVFSIPEVGVANVSAAEKSVDDCSLSPEALSPEDAASYWYSQVEVTTHLGPLRRIWMGPQFTFRLYSQSPTTHESLVQLCYSDAELASTTWPERIESLKSSELNKVLSPCIEPLEMSAYYRSSKATGSEWSEFAGSNLFNQSSTSSLSVVNVPAADPVVNESSSLKLKATAPRIPGRRLIDAGGSSSAGRWRNRSGELTRPISIGGSHGSDLAIFIEGGSYQDSSLGGSLSSLVSRSVDDVASCIADAMQDDDTCWSVEKTPCDLAVPITPSGPPCHLPATKSNLISNLGECHFAVGYSLEASLQSALSEADFPSQDTSPVLFARPVEDNLASDISCPTVTGISDGVATGVLDVDRADTADANLNSQRVTPKKTKRSKKGRGKTYKPASRSAGQLTPEDKWNDSPASFSSPLVSDHDSLSTSSAITSDMHAGLECTVPPAYSHQFGDGHFKPTGRANPDLTCCYEDREPSSPTAITTSQSSAHIPENSNGASDVGSG